VAQINFVINTGKQRPLSADVKIPVKHATNAYDIKKLSD
jgi:hypothetical protein